MAGKLGSLPYHAAHKLYGIHIDTGFGGADVYRGAYKVSSSQSTRHSFDELFVTCAETFLHQSTEAADEVYSHILGNTVKGKGVLYRVSAAHSNQHGDRCYADSFIYDRNFVFFLYSLAGFNQVFGFFVYFLVNLFAGAVYVAVCTVQERNAHSDGSDVQIFLLNHSYGFHYVIKIQHSVSFLLYILCIELKISSCIT